MTTSRTSSGSPYAIHFINTGGTISMGNNAAGKLVPVYDVRHFALAMELDELMISGKIPAAQAQEILKKLTDTKHFIFDRSEAKLQRSFEEITILLDYYRDGAEGLHEIMQKHGFNGESSLSSPYFIDSIKHSTDEHQPELHQQIEKRFLSPLPQGKHHSVIILGGTDSEQWYASLEGKDMHRRGYFAEGHKLVFTSSMHGFEDHPLHVARVIKGAKRVAKNPKVPGGAYAVSARKDDAKKVAVYDVRRDFIKIGTDTNAFRGIHVGTSVSGEMFGFDTEYVRRFIDGEESVIPSPEEYFTDPTRYARVAPPILSGSSTSEIIALLTEYAKASPQFDAIIIEGLPGITGVVDDKARDLGKITNLVKNITEAGTKVIFNNNRIYNEKFKTGSKVPVLVPEIKEQWQKSTQTLGFLNRTQKAAAEGKVIICEQTPNDAYNRALLKCVDEAPTGTERESEEVSSHPIATLGIRYTPSTAAFQQGVEIAVNMLRNTSLRSRQEPTLVISGLPGNCISPDHAEFLRRLTAENGVKILVAFDYNGRAPHRRIHAAAEEPEENPYEAAGACADIAQPCSLTPQEAMQEARRAFMKAAPRRVR